MNTILQKYIPSFSVLMKVEESAVFVSARWLFEFRSSDYNSCSGPLYQMDTDTILEETTPIRLEVFHYRLKTITQDAFGSSH